MGRAPATETTVGPVATRVGAAWRELRRGASMQTMRERLYAGLPHEVDLGQVDTLELLVRDGEQRMRDLAEALRVDRSTATRAVDRLVQIGLAERIAATDDRRGVVVRATPEGEELHRQITDRRRRFLLAVLDGFDEHEQVLLAELLERLVARTDALLRGEDRPLR